MKKTMKKTMKKKNNEEIIKRREFILKILVCFMIFSIVILFSIGIILEEKNINIDIYLTLFIIYGLLMFLLTYLLSAKRGATKGGYCIPRYGIYNFSINITPKMGEEKIFDKDINSYEGLLMHFDKTKYEKKNIKVKGHNIIIYCNEVYSCINGYAIVKSNKNILEDIETIKKECSEVLIDYSENRDTISFNLMIIIYSSDKLDYKEYMKKLDMPDLYGFDELIIPGLIENNKLKYLNYIKGPMEHNYYLCIKELKKILKKRIN